ncbi:MAG: carboxylesterase family protein, partial [Saprospiraceae bacterium]|nr:carboxylesterase family protein [Saprospiraceae bacterium]
MKNFYVLLLLFCSALFSNLTAQTRYLHPVFAENEISVTSNVVYGFNTTVLAFPTLIKQPLIMDVYRPASDTETNRPVVLYLHTGNFLPFQNPQTGDPGFNGSCGGTIRDSSVVYACRQLARMGYVAAAVDYRLGWNPLASSDVDRRYGIINATYRGIQDTRSAIRYFKKTVFDGNNTWGIDTTKIVVWGQGTGGYLSLNSVFLDNYAKIPLSSGGKFLWDHDQNAGTPPIPMIIEGINGNIFGTSVGRNPTTGDTLCHINTPGHTSNFQLAVNMAGACADSAWIDAGQTPILSFHVPYDQFAPYGEGIVNVPGTNLQVVQVQGSYAIQQMLEAFGNNSSFDTKVIAELGGNRASAFANTPVLMGNNWTDPTPGLYPFLKPLVNSGGIMVPTTTAP